MNVGTFECLISCGLSARWAGRARVAQSSFARWAGCDCDARSIDLCFGLSLSLSFGLSLIVLGRGYIGRSFRKVGEKKAPNGTA